MQSKPRKKDDLDKALAKAVKAKSALQRVFWSVFNAYRESVPGTIKSVNPGKGGGGNSCATGHVKPNRSDFLADVEKAARAVLCSTQYRRFLVMAGMRQVPNNERDVVIMEKCGAEFFRRNIHPLSDYFRDVYCVPDRRRK